MQSRMRVVSLGILGLLVGAMQIGCGGSAKIAEDAVDQVETDLSDVNAEIDGYVPDLRKDEFGDTNPDLASDVPDGVEPDVLPDVPTDVTGTMPSEAGQIVISEFMAQSTVGTDAGEWVELYNATAEPLELAGCYMKDAATDSVPITGSLVVGAGQYVVLGVSADTSVNGGLAPDFVMAGYLLDNAGDTIRLECDGVEIDKVVYDASWVLNGVARQLDSGHLDAVSNDLKANWCLAGFGYGGKGKLGTPGAANMACEVVDPCTPNPCTGAPASVCQDGTTLKKYAVPGICTVEDGAASCDFEVITEDCSASSKVCKNGACVVPPDPCNPNPCTVPPEPSCTDNVANTWIVPGSCANVNGEADCTYEPQDIDCVALGKVCITGACQYEGQGVPPSAAGQVIVSEFMAKSQASTDPGEWLELYNTTGAALDLNGCVLKDLGNDNHTIAEPLVIPANGYLLIAKNADSALNHGLTPDYIGVFSLGNTGDEIILTCGGVEIDRVVYTSTWVTTGAAIQLNAESLDGVSNDLQLNWCTSQATYGPDSMKGTPGTANEVCVLPLVVNKCRLQEPLDVTQEAGTDLTVYGRVTALTITDLTTGNDPNPLLKGQAGYGPANTNPKTSLAWNWFDAAPADPWDALAAGELDMDQYVTTYATPATGTYHHAYRFSVDGGTTWTYCDRNAGIGADGSENDYQVTNAGTLTTTPGANPCDPNPCNSPDADSCSADGVYVITHAVPGSCEVVEGLAQCTYTEQTIDCSLDGKSCISGLCVAEGEGNIPTTKGQVLFTEFMPNSQSGTDEGEWMEIYNNTDTILDLAGCILTDLEASSIFPTPFLVNPHDYLALGRNADPVKNHGLPFDYIYSGIQLANSGDQLIIVCNEVTIDQVEYNGSWVTMGTAIQLNPASFDEAGNDLLENWCKATTVYGTNNKLGTPGEPNLDCAPPVVPAVDWCRFQYPETAEIVPSGSVTVYGRVNEANGTTVTDGVDSISGLVAQAGIGPDGSDPATSTDWVWTVGAGNPAWNAATAGEPGNDEYMVSLTGPATVGTYDMAWRFSLDNGTTWVYCDLNKGTGFDGSADGYTAANAATLNVVEPVDPCTPNPCSGKASECSSGTVALHYTAPGTCTVVGDQASCEYASTTEDCALAGKVCDAGACKFAGQGNQPMAGEVFVTEFMALSTSGTDNGEWIELYNIAAEPLDLGGCILKDAGTNNHVIVGPLMIQPGDYLVLAKSADPAANWGLVPDYVYADYYLSNSGDTITLECGGSMVDTVAYTAEWLASGVSNQLSTLHYDDVENDTLANWCLSTEVFGTAGKLGTPGLDNGDCVPKTIDWCRFQSPETASVETNQTVTVYGRIYEAGVTDVTTGVDAIPGIKIQAGFGADGSTPDDTWTWVDALGTPGWDALVAGEPNNDEYTAGVVPTVAGTYDMAFRVSLQEGVWVYCDLNKGEGMDGSYDGYSAANAASLTVNPPANPCDPNPCTGAAPVCNLDGTKAIEYQTPGVCTVEGGLGVCSYPNTVEVDCTLESKVCIDGYCVVPPLPRPAAGEVIFTELMPRAVSGTDKGEWVELYNGTAKDLDISNCYFKDSANSMTIPAGQTLVAGDYLVLAMSSDAALNYGVPYDLIWSAAIALTNSGEVVSFECDGVVVDTVTYTSTMVALGISAQLKTDKYNATDNDSEANWCMTGWDTYGTAGKRGTPGLVNNDCIAPTVNWCRYQWPLTTTVEFGVPTTTYGRVFEPGATTVTSGVDAISGLVAQAGYGPDGSDPAAAGWTWVNAAGNAAWDANAAGEPDNDEYMADLTPAAAGTYDVAFRFSLDNGATWVYCDKDMGDNMDGSENGYQPENAGSLTMNPQADPCSPNPCTAGLPAECSADNTKAIEYVTPGTCTNNGGVAECAYTPVEVDCTVDGKTCEAGVCVTTGGTPKPYFSEYVEGGSNNKALEIYNGGDAELDLSTCSVKLYMNGSATASTPLSLGTSKLAAGGVFVLCHSSITDTSHCSLTSASLTFNGNDAVELVCGGVTYDIIGKIGFNPGTAWVANSVSTLDMTLRVRCSVTGGDTDGTNDYDPSVPFAALAKDDLTDLGTYTCVN